jgi:hypothetical protein
MISPGDFIDNYRILFQYASWPDSTVYLVEHAYAIGNPFLLHLWSNVHLSTPQQQEAFHYEAQQLAALRHPFLVPLLAYGMMGDNPYTVMEYIPNSPGTLRDLLRQQPLLPQQKTLLIIAQVGQALAYLHEHRILHRQLDPDRIIFNQANQALLTDCGLPTILEALKASHHMPLPVHSAYTAPELERGGTTNSKLSDQYALGCIAYELLVGLPPSRPLMPPASINRELPPFIIQALLRALAPEPLARYPNVQAFLNALPLPPVAYEQDNTVTASSSGALVLPPSLPDETSPLPNNPLPELQPGVMASTGTIASAADAARTGSPRPRRSSLFAWGSDPGRRRRWLLVALCVLLIALLVGGGFFTYTALPAAAATVSIIPKRLHLRKDYTIAVVEVTPNAALAQVAAHVLSYTTPVQTKTVSATGKGHQNATAATGTITFSNVGQSVSIASGQTLTGADGVQVVTDTGFNIAVGQTVNVPAHAVQAGAGGNIRAYDIAGTYQVTVKGVPTTTIYAQNTQPFTGGQDAHDYTFVQQSDIDNAANPLVNQLTPTAQTKAQQQLGANEQMIGSIQCNPQIQSHHQANDRVTSFTLQVSVTCKGEAYDPRAVQAMAVQVAKTNVTPHYTVVGDVITGTPIFSNVDNQGTATFTVSTEDIAVYAFDASEKQQLAQSIAGKRQSDAFVVLLGQPGVTSATITTTGWWGNALPTTVQNITIVVKGSAGLHAQATG